MKPILIALFAVPFVVAAPAFAAETRPYSDAAFAAAQAQGRPIVIDVHAPWCPICAAQQRVIAATTADPRYAKMIVFRIDYDSQKPLWKKFGAQKQSTLIAFKGKRETGRMAYDASPAKVNALLASAVS